jgi:hypothetical protein
MIPDELPQRKNSSEFLFIPAIPTLEAWLLADPDWAAAELHLPKSEILRSFEGGKTSIAIIEMKKRIKNQFEQHPEKFAKRILEDFDVSTAASLSPSFGKFLEEIKTRSTSSTIPNRPRALVSKIGNAVFASLVAELQPVTKIVYKTADGHKHTAGDIRNAILAGNELGIAYMESVLRLARDFLSFQAEDEDDE